MNTKKIILALLVGICSFFITKTILKKYKNSEKEPIETISSTKIIRGPYLQSGTPESILIKWRSDKTNKGSIQYGTSLNSLNKSVSEIISRKDHEVKLENLQPNTTYFYQISDSLGTSVQKNEKLFFKTAPKTSTQQFVRAWILGDAGTANDNQRKVRDQYYNYVTIDTLAKNQTDMLLFLGDNAYRTGKDKEYQKAVFEMYPDILQNTVAWSCLGNHDGYSANSKKQSGPYYDIFSFPKKGEAGGVASGTEAYYSFDYANIHFIVLESHQLYNDATQMEWCKADIQQTQQDWIVTLFHHPPYTKGSHNSDTEKELIAMRTNFLPILEDYGVDLILSGHSHSYERSFYINGHYDVSSSFDTKKHIVGTNGHLSGKKNTADGAYLKKVEDTEGAVYITAGSSGKISGGSLNHKAMYSSLNQLGSCILEVQNNSQKGQDMTIKFLNDSGEISDYFTISKPNLNN